VLLGNKFDENFVLNFSGILYDALMTALTLTYNRSKHITKINLLNESFVPQLLHAKHPLYTLGNKQRLEQVFVIILNNALDELVKISPIQKRLLSINVKEENDLIKIEFKDNAGGIDEEILPNIFNAFESSKESSGMGVGLNIAQQIINDHQGEIRAFNSNKGAVFEISLPNHTLHSNQETKLLEYC
jgi:C4-dicarboxylate-specific signal transduction histidine kinase